MSRDGRRILMITAVSVPSDSPRLRLTNPSRYTHLGTFSSNSPSLMSQLPFDDSNAMVYSWSSHGRTTWPRVGSGA